MEFLRLFISLPVPDEIRNALVEYAHTLDAGDVRWTPAEQIHLTLQFLGKVDSNAVSELEVSLQRATAGIGPFALETADLGAFPSFRRPRVLWIGLTGETDSLLRLQAQIAEETARWCQKEENRKFSPHLTLGRVREGGKASRTLPSPLLRRWRASKVLLMRSQLSPHGATHTVMREFAL